AAAGSRLPPSPGLLAKTARSGVDERIQANAEMSSAVTAESSWQKVVTQYAPPAASLASTDAADARPLLASPQKPVPTREPDSLLPSSPNASSQRQPAAARTLRGARADQFASSA